MHDCLLTSHGLLRRGHLNTLLPGNLEGLPNGEEIEGAEVQLKIESLQIRPRSLDIKR